MTISCIHDGEKEDLTIEYFGHKKRISTCNDCKEYMKLLTHIKILEAEENIS